MKNINKQLVKAGALPVSLERIVQQTKSPEFYSKLIDDYQETGSYLKDLQYLGRKIETRVKKSLYSKNSVTSAYIEFKDFLSEKIYGNITTTEDLYRQLLYTLDLMRLNFDSMILRCDKQILNLENYAYYLHSKSLDSHDRINNSKQLLIETSNLTVQVEKLSKKSKVFKDRENYAFASLNLRRKLKNNQYDIEMTETGFVYENTGKHAMINLVDYLSDINNCCKRLSQENRYCIEISRNIIGPYLQFIKANEAFKDYNGAMQKLQEANSRMLMLFNQSSKELLRARENKTFDKLVAGIETSVV